MTALVIRKWRWILLGCITAAALLWPAIPLPDSSRRLAAIPREGIGFVTSELEFTEQDRKQLGRAGALQRVISIDDGSRMILNIIDGTHNRHAVHDPRYCFAGAGWKIAKAESIDLPLGKGVFLQLRRGEQECGALCFFDDGERQFSSALAYWMRTSLRRVTLGRSGDEPVLVLIRSLPGEPFSLERVRRIVLPGLGFQ